MSDSVHTMNITSTDQNSNVNDEPHTLDIVKSTGIIEVDVPPTEECQKTDTKYSDNLDHSNVIILGKNAPVDKNTEELQFFGITKLKEEDEKYDVYADHERIYKKYRLRETLNKPNYKIPSINDLPEQTPKKRAPPTYIPETGTFPCPQCRKEHNCETELRNHIRKEHNLKYTCSLCFETFESNTKLIAHKAIHDTENRSHICLKCKVAFSNHFDYLVHVFKHKTSKGKFKCEECGLSYKRHSFAAHMITHFNRELTCRLCPKYFQTETDLKDHNDTSHKIPFKTYQCVECDKVLKDKSSYNRHMHIHTGVKPYQCLYCGKGFRTGCQRMVHTRIHTQERSFQCSKCDLKFIQATDLQRHLLRHDTEKKYQCDVCQKKFVDKLGLTLHKKIHLKKYDCPECGKRFPSMTTLRIHALHHHSTERPVECKACNKTFATNAHLYKHKRSKIHRRHDFGLKMEREAEI